MKRIKGYLVRDDGRWEHYAVWEEHYGPAPWRQGYPFRIHHINGKKKDNHIENLVPVDDYLHQCIHFDGEEVNRDACIAKFRECQVFQLDWDKAMLEDWQNLPNPSFGSEETKQRLRNSAEEQIQRLRNSIEATTKGLAYKEKTDENH